MTYTYTKNCVFLKDLIDRGRGYDTNDSFVDDSEMVKKGKSFCLAKKNYVL